MNVLDDLGKGNTVYRAQFDTVTRENIGLKQRIEALEKENKALKRSVYELSNKLSRLEWEVSKAFQYDMRLGFSSFVPNGTTHSNQNTSLNTDHTNEEITSGLKVATDQNTLLNDSDSTELRLEGSPLDTTRSEIDFDIDGVGVGSSFSKGSDFKCGAEFREHTGAVYCLSWSPCGRFLASGSIDKSICIRSIVGTTCKTTMFLTGHEQLIADVAWAFESEAVISGSFDQTVKVWKVETSSKPLITVNVPGFVQSVQADFHHHDLMYCGTSYGIIGVIDKRTESLQSSARIQGKINTVHQIRINSNYLYSGDSKGKIKLWDIRKICDDSQIYELQNDEAGRPITHICSSAEYVSVNSYDDVLRVYNQQKTVGSLLDSSSLENRTEKSEIDLELVCSLHGHRNKNWPIRSSFFVGRTMNEDMNDLVSRRRNSLTEVSRLLATGSAQNVCYVFDLSNVNAAKTQRKLRGHSGRVYCCSFRPQYAIPILATASADSTIRLWQYQ